MKNTKTSNANLYCNVPFPKISEKKFQQGGPGSQAAPLRIAYASLCYLCAPYSGFLTICGTRVMASVQDTWIAQILLILFLAYNVMK